MHHSKEQAGKPIMRLAVNKLTFVSHHDKAGALLSSLFVLYFDVSLVSVDTLPLSQVYGEYRASLAFDLVSSRQKNVSEAAQITVI